MPKQVSIKVWELQTRLVALVGALHFIGIEVVTLLGVLYFPMNTSILTYPYIVFLALSSALLFLKLKPELKLTTSVKAAMVFFFLYSARLLYELIENQGFGRADVPKISSYFLIFVVLPFFFFNLLATQKPQYLAFVFRGIHWLALTTCALLVFWYGSLLFSSEFQRLASLQVQSDTNVHDISPLSAGYVAATLVITSLVAIVNHSSSKLIKISGVVGFVASVPVLLLSSSRGPILGLTMAIAALFFLSKTQKHNRGSSLLLIACGAFALIHLARGLNSGLMNRLNTLTEASIFQSKRMDLYVTSLQQYFSSPLIGNALKNETYDFFPHNVILEAAISVGIVGLLPFVYILFSSMRKSTRILRVTDSNTTWVSLLFIVFFVRAMFNSSIYLANELWCLLGILTGLQLLPKRLGRDRT